jgi:hypothetical protein
MKVWIIIMLAAAIVLASAASAETITRAKSGLFEGETFEELIPMVKGETLIVNSASTLAGDIVVNAGASQCRVRYQRVLKTDALDEAEKFAAAITVEAADSREGATVNLRAPAQAPWSGTDQAGRLRVEITVPNDCAVELRTSYFDIIARGPFNRFSVPESLSKVSVENVNGALEVQVSNRPLTVRNVKGKLVLSNRYSPIKVEDVDTQGESGEIRNEHGEVTVENYRGEIDLRTSYDRITTKNLYLTGNNNRVRNLSGVIMLDVDSLTTGKLRVNNELGKITVDIRGRADAQFICKVGEKSRVQVERMTFQPTLVYTGRLEFVTGAGTAEVRLTAKDDGDIIINGSETNTVSGGD